MKKTVEIKLKLSRQTEQKSFYNVFFKFKNELIGFYSEMSCDVVSFPIPQGNPEVVFSAFNKLI